MTEQDKAEREAVEYELNRLKFYENEWKAIQAAVDFGAVTGDYSLVDSVKAVLADINEWRDTFAQIDLDGCMVPRTPSEVVTDMRSSDISVERIKAERDQDRSNLVKWRNKSFELKTKLDESREECRISATAVEVFKAEVESVRDDWRGECSLTARHERRMDKDAKRIAELDERTNRLVKDVNDRRLQVTELLSDKSDRDRRIAELGDLCIGLLKVSKMDYDALEDTEGDWEDDNGFVIEAKRLGLVE